MAHEVAYAVQYRPRWIITAVAAGALRQRQHGPVMINTFEPNRQDRREVYIYIYISEIRAQGTVRQLFFFPF